MSEPRAELPADVPPFRVGRIEFACFAAWDQDGTPYVWRSACRRAAVGRLVFLVAPGDSAARSRPPGASGGEMSGAQDVAEGSSNEPGATKSACWARVDGRLLGKDYPSLRAAMIAAAMDLMVREAA